MGRRHSTFSRNSTTSNNNTNTSFHGNNNNNYYNKNKSNNYNVRRQEKTFHKNNRVEVNNINKNNYNTNISNDNVFRPLVAERTSKDGCEVNNSSSPDHVNGYNYANNNNNNNNNKRGSYHNNDNNNNSSNNSTEYNNVELAKTQEQAERATGSSSESSFAKTQYGVNKYNTNTYKRNVPYSNKHFSKPHSIVVILEKAGLVLGQRGLVDAYDRAQTTEIVNLSLKDVRPDIVHQCLLALFDSTLAYEHQLRVYINVITSHNLSSQRKVIEVSPSLRPPRTLARFKGVMAELFKTGRVVSQSNEILLRLLPTSIAPVIPYGARVTSITNSLLTSTTANENVVTFTELARENEKNSVSNNLQGGIKDVTAFYVISCTDDINLDGIDYTTERVCCSAYPMTAHVMCARLCEAHAYVRKKEQDKS